MSNVINLGSRINSDFTYTDELNQVWRCYAYNFEFNDKTYGYNIWARNIDEAKDMLEAIAATGQIIGEVVEEITNDK